MTAKLEWTVVVVLAVAGIVTYRELDTASEQAAEEKAARERALAEQAGVIPRVEAERLPAVSHSEGLPQRGHWRGNPVLADLDADGDLDLVASIRRWDRSTPAEGLHVWLNDGSNRWIESTSGMRRDMSYGGADVGDIDGDGDLDIAFSGHDVTPHVFFGDGTGKWITDAAGIDIEVICSDVALGDADGDGDIDLAAMGFYPEGGGLYVFRNDGTGQFELGWTLVPPGTYGAFVTMRDIEDDGALEILASTQTGTHVWRYDAENDLFDEQSQGLPVPTIGGSELGLDVADLDGDGTKEILVAGMIYEGHTGLQLFRWDGTTWALWGEGLPEDEAFYDIDFARLTADGPPVIVAAGQHGINIIDMVAPGRFERRGRVEGTDGVIHVARGDLTGDGIDEIVYVGFSGVRVLELATSNGESL